MIKIVHTFFSCSEEFFLKYSKYYYYTKYNNLNIFLQNDTISKKYLCLQCKKLSLH